MLNTFSNQFSKLRKNLVENFDIFGQQPTMRILQQKKFTSGVGCCMTITICSITLTYLITQLLILEQKSQPKLVISEQQIFDTDAFPLQNDNFTLVVSLASVDLLPLKGQHKYYNLTINHCVRQRKLNETTNTLKVIENCTQLPIAPCQLSDFDNEIQKNFFKTARLGAMQCIDREYLRNSPPALQGQFSGIVYQYLAIYITLCQNSTTYQGCAPKEEIESVLSAGHYTVYASDYMLQFNEPNEPYQQIITMDFSTFSISSSKTLQWNYRIQETHTDDGYFLSNDDVIQNLRKQSIREETDLYNNRYLVCHYIKIDYLKTVNQRSYIKMQTILSQVGGFWQVLIVIASTFIGPLVNGLMIIEMANELYRFKSGKKDQELPKPEERVETPIKQDENRLHCNQSDKDGKLTNSFFESLLLLLGCDRQRVKLYQRAKFDIMEKLDIARMIQKNQEIDMLKYILLSDQQYKLFEILPKPLIHENNPQQIMNDEEVNFFQLSSRSSRSGKTPNSNIEDYVLSFQQVSKQQCLGINEKLLQMMDKNILSIFESYQRKVIQKLTESEPKIQIPR